MGGSSRKGKDFHLPVVVARRGELIAALQVLGTWPALLTLRSLSSSTRTGRQRRVQAETLPFALGFSLNVSV